MSWLVEILRHAKATRKIEKEIEDQLKAGVYLDEMEAIAGRYKIGRRLAKRALKAVERTEHVGVGKELAFKILSDYRADGFTEHAENVVELHYHNCSFCQKLMPQVENREVQAEYKGQGI